MSFIPKTYDEWEHCITVKCGIPLTPEYIAQRIEAMQDIGDHDTQKFIERWGKDHHARTVGWFLEAQGRLQG
ncbi:MAG: hypothetical protein AAF625_19190 [Pseudomonadota bacterium]